MGLPLGTGFSAVNFGGGNTPQFINLLTPIWHDSLAMHRDFEGPNFARRDSKV
jgi:hypothetical protein